MRTSGTTKWEITYEDEESISVFKYNLDITKNGPVSVDFKYKAGYKHPTEQKKKTLGDLAQEARKRTRTKK